MDKRDKVISIRISPETYKELDFFSDKKQETKMEIVRQAISSFLEEANDAFDDAALEDYINLRIDEENYLKETGLKKVPRDIAEERKKKLQSIANKSNK